MSRSPARILDRRDGWVAVDKPPGIPTEAAPGFDDDLLTAVAATLGVAAGVHAVNRLDTGVSGVVLVVTDATGRRDAARFTRGHHLRRRYVGLTAGASTPARGRMDAPVGKDSRRWVVGGRDARPAVTDYGVVAEASGVALVAFEPLTGRTHQIRVHAAAAGHPLLFDRGHGGPPRVTTSDGRVLALTRVALHAARFEVPLADGPWVVEAPVPVDLTGAWAALGGDGAAWERALAAPVGDPSGG